MRFQLRPPRLRLSENHVEKACLDLLRLRGYWVVRQHAGRAQYKDGTWTHLGDKGLPDYATVHAKYPGFLLECKAPGKHLSDAQLIKISEIYQGYRLAICVADSVESMLQWLNEHEARSKGP